MDDELLLSPSEIYHENSKLHRDDLNTHARIVMFNSSPQIRAVLARPMPTFRGTPSVALSGASGALADVVKARRTAKEGFAAHVMPVESLGHILALSCGVTATGPDVQGIDWPLRASPSGGALYPLDVYVAALTVEGVTPGLYLYRSTDHSLGLIRAGDLAADLAEASALGSGARPASACVILSAAMARSKVKYGERSYRFLLLEAGHVAQNILLAATDTALIAVPVGGFIDDEMNRLIDADGCAEAVLYMVFIGR